MGNFSQESRNVQILHASFYCNVIDVKWDTFGADIAFKELKFLRTDIFKASSLAVSDADVLLGLCHPSWEAFVQFGDPVFSIAYILKM